MEAMQGSTGKYYSYEKDKSVSFVRGIRCTIATIVLLVNVVSLRCQMETMAWYKSPDLIFNLKIFGFVFVSDY